MAVNPSIKNLENTQFGRVCTDDIQPGGAGNRHAGSANMDDGLEPLLDSNGRLIVRIANGGGFIEEVGYDFTSLGVYTNEFFVTTGLARNIEINGYSDLPVSAYIQIHSTNPPVLAGAVPFLVIPIGAGPGAFFKSINLKNGSGLPRVIAISSTQFIYTAIATPCLYVYTTGENVP